MTAGNNESCLKRQKILRGECTTKRRENEKIVEAQKVILNFTSIIFFYVRNLQLLILH